MFRDCMEPEVLSWSDASNNESIQQGKAGWIHNPVSAYIVAKQRKLVTADGINHHRSLAGPHGRHETDTPRHIGIWKFSKNVDASKEWIRYLLGKREVYDEYIMSGEAFNLPVYEKLQDHPVLRSDPKYAALKGEGVQYHTYGWPSHFIGLTNFIRLWDSDAFRQTFQNAFVFTGISIAFKLVLGISLALLLNQQLWFKRMIRGAVLLPWVIPTALSTLGWWWMFNSLYSVVNWTGIALGLMEPPGPNWLGQKYYAMTAVVVVNVWRGLPFFAITILAGLVSIPRELYEAAEADGANANARFWHITLPLLKPVLAVVVLFSTIFTFSDFNIVYILTHGGPINSTHLFATLSRMLGLEVGRIGEGAAVSLYLFPLLAFVVWAQLRFVRKQAY